MPLVSLNTVNRWYRKDSWVYKNFAYLFQNALWQKRVPSGFSLCPYFWLALFSMTFFRLFIGLCLLTGWTLGNGLKYVGRFYRPRLEALGFGAHAPDSVAAFVGLLFTAMVLAVGFLVCVAGYMLVSDYAHVQALPALFLPLVLLTAFIVCCVRVEKPVAAVATKVGEGVVWALAEAWTFICLLCSLIKAKKQGACPLQFTEPTKAAQQPEAQHD